MEKIFVFEDNQNVRTVEKDGELWFVASDVLKALGIAQHRKAVRILDDDEKGVTFTATPGGDQSVIIVSESGLYTIMLRSHGAMKQGTVAYRFRRWVTHEVLPSIRKTGSYTVTEQLAIDTLDLPNSVARAFIRHRVDMAWRVRRAMKRAQEKSDA